MIGSEESRKRWEEKQAAKQEEVYISQNRIIEGDFGSDVTYHSSPDCGGMNTTMNISKFEANRREYKPCDACYGES